MASEKKKNTVKRKGSNENDDERIKKKNKTTESNQNQNQDPLRFFVDQFQAANGLHLSSLELESLKDTTILKLSNSEATDTDLDVKFMAGDVKGSFGDSWRKDLCESEIVEGKVGAGSPSVLVVSYSALRSIHLLKGFRSFTKQCGSVKLFSKHIKLQEQISLLKNRVNIASGTPSRIKKLIDIEALGLSRLKVLVLDIHPDVKGFSLFTLPQVKDEFWDLFKNYFYQPMIQGDLRLCLYGPCKPAAGLKAKKAVSVPDE